LEELPVEPPNSTESTSAANALDSVQKFCGLLKDQVYFGQALCPTMFISTLKELRSLLVDDLFALANRKRFSFRAGIKYIRSRKRTFQVDFITIFDDDAGQAPLAALFYRGCTNA
jgi:hypothetical protein